MKLTGYELEFGHVVKEVYAELLITSSQATHSWKPIYACAFVRLNEICIIDLWKSATANEHLMISAIGVLVKTLQLLDLSASQKHGCCLIVTSKMGSINSKAVVQHNQKLSKKTQSKTPNKAEGKLAANIQKTVQNDRKGNHSQQSSNKECESDNSDRPKLSQTKRKTKCSSNLPQFTWLVSSVVEDDFKKISKIDRNLKSCHPKSPLLSQRGQTSKDELTSPIDLVSARPKTNNSIENSPPKNHCSKNLCSVQSIALAPTRTSDTSLVSSNSGASDSDDSGITAEKYDPHLMSGSVGFGVLTSTTYLENYVTGRSTNVHGKWRRKETIHN